MRAGTAMTARDREPVRKHNLNYRSPTRQERGHTTTEHPLKGGKDLRIICSMNAGTRRRQCGAQRHLEGLTDIPTKTPGAHCVYHSNACCFSDSNDANDQQ